jgi:hypothetical protein
VNPKKFFAELKRRHVYKVAIAYAVVAWLLIQIATQVFPFFEIPNWTVRLVVLLIAIGFPIASRAILGPASPPHALAMLAQARAGLNDQQAALQAIDRAIKTRAYVQRRAVKFFRRNTRTNSGAFRR